jgi:MFS family permease
MDKGILSVAAVLGILEDTHITLTQYSWVNSTFYLDYFVFQMPNNYLLQRFPIGKYLSVLLICWGATCTALAFGENFTQLALRGKYNNNIILVSVKLTNGEPYISAAWLL